MRVVQDLEPVGALSRLLLAAAAFLSFFWPVMAYGGSLAQAILHMKHGRRRHLAPTVGGAARASRGPRQWLTAWTTLCPRAASSPSPAACVGSIRPWSFSGWLSAWCAGRGRSRTILPNSLRRIRDTPSLGLESPATRRRIVGGAFRGRARALRRAEGFFSWTT